MKGRKFITDFIAHIVGGMSVEGVAHELGIGVKEAQELYDRLKMQNLLARQPRRSHTGHRLIRDDKKRGGHASQITRQKQRQDQFVRILALLDTSSVQPITIACLSYYLWPGSDKEFSITILQEDVGVIFLQALREIGVPDDRICFKWHKHPGSNDDAALVRRKWGALGSRIEFSGTGNNQSLKLRVAQCRVMDAQGVLKISSRALGRAFKQAGARIVRDVTG